jgi:hypothetical protein
LSESNSEEALHHPVLDRPREAVLAESTELLSRPSNNNESRNLVVTLSAIGLIFLVRDTAKRAGSNKNN